MRTEQGGTELLPTETLDFGNGETLRVARLGAGPPLLLLHGYPGNLQIFCRLAPLLAEDYAVIALDWPGMGYSSAWKGGTAPLQLAKRLCKILDFLGLEKVNLLGQDMGGQPVLAFAERYPERVGKVLVLNSLLQWDVGTSWEIRVLRKLRFNVLLLRYFPRLVFWRACRTFFSGGTRLTPAAKTDLWEAFSQKPVREYIIRMCFGYEAQLPRLPQRYAKIAAPVLFLWGEKGKHFPLRHAKATLEQVKNGRLVVLSAAPHWMVYQNSGLVADAIRKFLTNETLRA